MFNNCSKLEYIEFSNAVTKVELNAFKNASLKTIKFNGTEAEFDKIDVSKKSDGNDAFLNATVEYATAATTEKE